MKTFLSAICMLLLLSACDEQCPAKQDNEILRSKDYTDAIYQNELIHLIESAQSMRYYFNQRETIGSDNFLLVNCFGDSFCGKLRVLVQTEDRLTQQLHNNSAHNGAELVGLQLAHLRRKSDDVMVYQGMDHIFD